MACLSSRWSLSTSLRRSLAAKHCITRTALVLLIDVWTSFEHIHEKFHPMISRRVGTNAATLMRSAGQLPNKATHDPADGYQPTQQPTNLTDERSQYKCPVFICTIICDRVPSLCIVVICLYTSANSPVQESFKTDTTTMSYEGAKFLYVF